MLELEIRGIEVDCIIGELDHERTTPQKITVDARLEISDAAAHTDELGDTVDYVELAEKIRAVLVGAKCKMLERAAYLAASVAKGMRGVKSASASVTKAGAVQGIASATATCKIGWEKS